ncbi:zinc ribbon-containing protein [Thalassotalea piscium]
MSNKTLFDDFYNKLSVWLTDVKQHEVTQIVELVEEAKVVLSAAESIPEDKVKQFIDNFKYDLHEFYKQNEEEAKHSIFLGLMNESFWAALAEITDQSQVEWTELGDDFELKGDYQVGDYIGFGKLICAKCHESVIILHPTKVTECINCHHTHFIRESLSPSESII